MLAAAPPTKGYYKTMIRPAQFSDCHDLARIQVDSYRSAYAGLLPRSYLDCFNYQEQEQDWQDFFTTHSPDALFVAETESGLLAGYALVRMEKSPDGRFDGEVAALHIRRDYQHQSFGRQLMAEAACWIQSQGGKSLFLTVLEGNPARQFYEKLGGVLQPDTRSFWIDDFEAIEVIYGWEDLNHLIQKAD